jgi:hypothetical protein
MSEETKISDRGLAVLAFAIYHQLESGNRVTQVVLDDGSGHHADMEAVGELQRLDLIAADDRRVSFTKKGEAVIDEAIAGMRRMTSAALDSTAGKQGARNDD